MKSRSLKIIVIGLFILSLCIIPIKIGADSGWDGGYDSGSSSSSWSSSDWGSSGGSDWGSSGGSGLLAEFVGLSMVIIAVFIVRLYSKRNNSNSNESIAEFSDSVSEDDIKNILPAFNYSEFRQQIYASYKEIQISWMNFDHEKLKHYCTDELYNLYKSQLEVLKVKNEQNIMQDFSLLDFAIKTMETNDDIISLTVLARISCHDYVINCDSKKVLRGTDKQKVCYVYEMIFTRSIKENANVCPSCGANLENQQNNVCPYCRSTVIGNNYDWVLSKKQVLYQYYTKN